MSTIEELTPQPADRIVCVKVGSIQRENLYEMSRKYWKIKLQRASKATHVLAIIDGAVEAVYIPQKWSYTKVPEFSGRIEFVGTEDKRSPYLGKDVRAYYGRSSNPVTYINM